MTSSWAAPRGDGEWLLDPPLDHIAACGGQWRNQRASVSVCVNELPLAELHFQARSDALSAAMQHARHSLVDDVAFREFAASSGPLILSGHQPELFHAGVWFKNFVLDAAARHSLGVPLNLIVDNDVPRARSIQVPAGSIDSPRWETIPFDRSMPDISYEESGIIERTLFDSFDERVSEVMRAWRISPLVLHAWPAARELAKQGCGLGVILAAIRHRIETRWGSRTLELPLSTLCDQPAFAHFLTQGLRNGAAWHAAYNAAIRDYRRNFKVRSRTHPASELTSTHDWLEMPFWIWSETDPIRRRLHARRAGGAIELAHHPASQPLAVLRDSSPTAAVEQLRRIRGEGIKIRPRALMTTLFARLVLGDVFIHGIGGAKYDRATDQLMTQLFDVTPPKYVVATATHRLPIDRPSDDPLEVEKLRRRLRDLEYHPERFVDLMSRSDGKSLVDEKRWLIENPTVRTGRDRHLALVQTNEALRARLTHARDQTFQQWSAARVLERNRKLIASREFSFALFPETFLRERLTRWTTPIS